MPTPFIPQENISPGSNTNCKAVKYLQKCIFCLAFFCFPVLVSCFLESQPLPSPPTGKALFQSLDIWVPGWESQYQKRPWKSKLSEWDLAVDCLPVRQMARTSSMVTIWVTKHHNSYLWVTGLSTGGRWRELEQHRKMVIKWRLWCSLLW